MVDSEYRRDNIKALKITIGAIIQNPEMLWFVPDHFKTKKMSKNAVKKLRFVLRYFSDHYKTQRIIA